MSTKRSNVHGIVLMALLAVVAVSGPLAVLEIQQTAYAQQQEAGDSIQNVTELIVAVGALVGSVATIISLVGSRYLAKHGDNETVRQIVYTADGLKGTDEALLEAREDIVTILDVVTRISPEAKAELERRGQSIQQARVRLDELRQDVDRIYKVVEKYT